MISAFAKAVAQLRDRRIIHILLLSLAVSAAVFVALWIGVGVLLANTTLFQTGWLDSAIDVLGGLATVVITWLLFPAVVSATIGLFLENVAEEVERKHYPHLPAVRHQGMGEVIAITLKFLTIIVVLNILMLVFLLFPPVFPFVFYGINGYLLGREYFELVGMRRLEPGSVTNMRRQHRLTVFVTGLVIAFLLTVPFVNLLAPIVGTAAMVHVFERLRTSKGPSGRSV